MSATEVYDTHDSGDMKQNRMNFVVQCAPRQTQPQPNKSDCSALYFLRTGLKVTGAEDASTAQMPASTRIRALQATCCLFGITIVNFPELTNKNQ